jgi:hypothetical protein
MKRSFSVQNPNNLVIPKGVVESNVEKFFNVERKNVINEYVNNQKATKNKSETVSVCFEEIDEDEEDIELSKIDYLNVLSNNEKYFDEKLKIITSKRINEINSSKETNEKYLIKKTGKNKNSHVDGEKLKRALDGTAIDDNFHTINDIEVDIYEDFDDDDITMDFYKNIPPKESTVPSKKIEDFSLNNTNSEIKNNFTIPSSVLKEKQFHILPEEFSLTELGFIFI